MVNISRFLRASALQCEHIIPGRDVKSLEYLGPGGVRAVDRVRLNEAADVSRRILSEAKLAPTHVGGYFGNWSGGGGERRDDFRVRAVPKHQTPALTPADNIFSSGRN